MRSEFSPYGFIMCISVGALLIMGGTSAVAQQGSCIEPDTHAAMTYFLVDRSDKLTDPDSLKQLFSALPESVNKDEKGERLMVGVITGKASKTRLVMDRVHPEKTMFKSRMKTRKQERQFRECLTEIREILFAKGESHKTSAILETLSFVAKVFNNEPGAGKRLIIFSDMIQNSDTMSFYGKQIDKSPEQLITHLQEEALLPSFDGVEVYVGGVGGILSDKKTRKIERFWQEYFKKVGAKLKFYGPLLTGL